MWGDVALMPQRVKESVCVYKCVCVFVGVNPAVQPLPVPWPGETLSCTWPCWPSHAFPAFTPGCSEKSHQSPPRTYLSTSLSSNMNNLSSLQLRMILSTLFFHVYIPRILNTIVLPLITHSCLISLDITSPTFLFYQRKRTISLSLHHRSNIRDYSFTWFSDNTSPLMWLPTSPNCSRSL